MNISRIIQNNVDSLNEILKSLQAEQSTHSGDVVAIPFTEIYNQGGETLHIKILNSKK